MCGHPQHIARGLVQQSFNVLCTEYVNVTRDDCTRVENKNCLSQVLKTALRKRKFTFTNTKSALDELPATQAKRRKAAEEKDAAAAEGIFVWLI